MSSRCLVYVDMSVCLSMKLDMKKIGNLAGNPAPPRSSSVELGRFSWIWDIGDTPAHV